MNIVNFTTRLKIKHKLRVPVFLYMVLLVIVTWFYFNSSRLIDMTNEEQQSLSALSVNIYNTALATKNFVYNNLSFNELEDKYDQLIAQLENHESLNDIKTIKNLVLNIHILKKKNSAIEAEIIRLADTSIKNSNEYIKMIGQKLADENTRYSVSTLERLVIIGANLNTSSNYDLKILFGRLKEDITVKTDLLGFLEILLENVEKDVKNLAGTPFEQLPIEAKKANLKIKELAAVYIQNIETVLLNQADTFHIIKEIVQAIDAANFQNSENLFITIKNNFSRIIMALIIMALLGTFINTLFSKSISDSIRRLTMLVKDLASEEGDLTTRMKLDSRDELGELADCFNVFLEKMQDIIKQLAMESSSVNRSSNELTGIADEMDRGTQSMSVRADAVLTAAEELSSTMISAAASMEQSSSNSNMVASAAEEMNFTINEIAASTEQAKNISKEAAQKANNASSEMNELNKAANSVDKIVETISNISKQVNLLALNATIEAARAGEAGKGFAVVANEIKALAGQTSDATLDIKSQIENIQNVSSQTTDSILKVTSAINSTQKIVSSIALSIEEQSSATNEISSNVEQLSSGIREVNKNVAQSSLAANDISREISGVNTASREISDNSSHVKDRAVRLKEMAEKLNQIVAAFIIK